MTISIRFTYETIDAEGEVVSRGFCNPDGYPLNDFEEEDDLFDRAKAESWQEAGDLADCVKSALDLGIYEDAGGGRWFSSTNGMDTRGETTDYSIHFNGVPDKAILQIQEIFKKGRLDEEDENFLDEIDGQLSVL